MHRTGHHTVADFAVSQWKQHVAAKALEYLRRITAAGKHHSLTVYSKANSFISRQLSQGTQPHPNCFCGKMIRHSYAVTLKVDIQEAFTYIIIA
jgi:hypothetical protein